MRTRGAVMIVLALVVIAGCNPLPDRSPVGPVEIQRPDFLGVIQPASGEIEVPLNSNVVFAFSEPVDAATANGALAISFLDQYAVGTFKNTGSSIIDSTVSDTVNGEPVYTYTYEHYLTFTPAENYHASALYSVHVTGSIKDLHGNSLSIDPEYGDSTWFFTTGDYAEGGWYKTYVVEQITGELLDFDTPDTAVSRISGLESPRDVVISDDGQYVVVSNKVTNGYVSVFDRTLSSQTNVSVGVGPEFMATTGGYAFVVNTSSNTISTITLSSATESSTLSFDDGFDPGILQVDEQGSRLVVASAASGAPEILKVLDIGSGGVLTESSTIDFSADTTMDRAASGLAVYGDEAFVQEDLSSKIHVIDLLSGTYEETFSVFLTEIADGDTTVSGDRSRGMVAREGTAYMWSLEGILFQIDLPSRSLIQYKTLSSRPRDIAFTPEGDLLYIALDSEDMVAVYEPDYLTKLAEAPATSGSRAIAVGRVKG